MPWTCMQCGHEVALDTSDCPACAEAKSAWTVGEQTRHVVVGRAASFELLVGEEVQPRAPGAEPATLVAAREVPLLPKAYLRQLAARGLEPAPADTLYVRLRGKPGQDEVSLELLFAGDAPADSIQRASGEGRERTLALVLAWGPGEVSGLAFAGAEVVDAGEPESGDPATDASFRALGKPARELPCAARGALCVRLRDGEGQPVAGVQLQASQGEWSSPRGESDREGWWLAALPDPSAPATLSSPSEGAPLLPHNSYTPAPFPGRPQLVELDPSQPYPGSLRTLIDQIKRIELALPADWSGHDLLLALLERASVMGPSFRAMLGSLPPVRALPRQRERVEDLAERTLAQRYLVEPEEVLGQEGEGLADVARRVGVPLERLARFSYGTDDPRRVELALAAWSGCRRTDAQGRVRFGPRDAPGSVWVPRPWSQGELAPLGAPLELELRSHGLGCEGLLTERMLETLNVATFHGSAFGCGTGEETGIPLDGEGRPVSTSHMLLGVIASEHRQRELNMGSELAKTYFQDKQRSSTWWLDEGAWTAGGLIGRSLAYPAGYVGSVLDNLWALTLSGDLGQVAAKAAALHAHKEQLRMEEIGVDFSEASEGELTGDIDGVLLGELLPAWREEHLGGRTLQGELRLSEVLERYYGGDPELSFPVHAGNRYAEFRQRWGQAPAELLAEQIRRFAWLFQFKIEEGVPWPDHLAEARDDVLERFLAWLSARS